MEKMKLRCHFSIIFENLWQFWLVIIIMLVQQAENLIRMIRDIGAGGIRGLIDSGGGWVLAGLMLLTVAVLCFSFFRWRKTWIILDDNLVIIERNTLKKYKNTIAVENISAVNMEQNLFERLVGTYKIKMDTGSMTTANKTDVAIVLKEADAIRFRKAVLEKISEVKGTGQRGLTEDSSKIHQETAVSPETHPDRLFDESAGGRKVFHSDKKDMLMHAVYTMPLISLFIAAAGVSGGIWYICVFGFASFIENAFGGFIALILMVLSAVYSLIKKFVTYYDFTVYRDGRDLHIRCGLIKLRSYTIPVDKITALQIEQPLISRVMKKYSVKVVTVGIGDEAGENSNITMSVSAEELMERLTELAPEYSWAAIGDIEKEQRGSIAVRAVKSVKWHIFTVCAVLLLYFEAGWPVYTAAAVPVALDVFINLLYILSHLSSGYSVKEEGLLLSGGYFRRVYTICTYEKMQILTMNYHPVARGYGIGDGAVKLLNFAAGIPYLKKETAFEISKRIIRGGTK